MAVMCHMYLEEPVERNPEEEDIGKEFHEVKHAVDHPVSQPLGIIILLLCLNRLDATSKQQSTIKTRWC